MTHSEYNVPFHNSGALQGGLYIVQISTHAINVCAAGTHLHQTASVVGSLVFTPPVCPADTNGDGQFTPADVAAYVQSWLNSLTAGVNAADFDGNGRVDPADIAWFIQVWLDAVAGGEC